MTQEVVNTVEFGADKLHFAEYDDSNNTYKNIERIKGLVTIKLKSKSNDLKLHADDGVYFTLVNNNGYEGELEIYNFDNEFKINYLGYKKDGNGVLVEPAVFFPKTYALLFKIQGDKKDRHTTLYNVTFSKTDTTHKTVDDKIDVEALKIEFKATPIEFSNFEGKVVQASSTNPTRTAKWFTKVYIPSTSPTEA